LLLLTRRHLAVHKQKLRPKQTHPLCPETDRVSGLGSALEIAHHLDSPTILSESGLVSACLIDSLFGFAFVPFFLKNSEGLSVRIQL
jgi:hypothetical protein